jgi:hypothetical protein
MGEWTLVVRYTLHASFLADLWAHDLSHHPIRLGFQNIGLGFRGGAL